MIMIPILVFLMIEQVLSGFIFYIFYGDTEEVDLKSLQNLGIFGLLVAVIITNGLLTYIISKNILTPVNQMIRAVKRLIKRPIL